MRHQHPAQINHVSVREISERDGLKLMLEDGSWLLLRASGTEPVLRIYAEADTAGKVEGLLNAGVDLVSAGEIQKAA
jgi:phosphomannomutase